jgi:arylsulfatase A-like enzyme
MALREGNLKILADPKAATFELYDVAEDPQETTDLKEKRPEDFEALKARLLSENTSVESEAPDWWKRLSPSGGTPPGVKPSKKQPH